MSAQTSFPIVFSEPNDDWTVEEGFQWVMINTARQVDRKCATIEKELVESFNKGVKELWKLHDDLKNNNSECTIESNDENKNDNAIIERDSKIIAKATRPGDVASTAVAAPSYGAAPAAKSSPSLRVEITGGQYYVGHVFHLRPTPVNPCLIGRSKGAKFTKRGISLPKDLEVSTSHGKFQVDADGKYYYVDTGSTNGSFVGGDQTTELEPDVPYLITDGLQLKCGGTLMKISISH